MRKLRAFVVTSLFAVSACASNEGHSQHKGKQAGPAAGLNQSAHLLERARAQQAKAGCAAAAPTYRVIASFGDGYEIAQYELGACLMEMQGANSTETRLFRTEAAFWLTRAAFAGNARAQHDLAIALSGVNETAGVAHDPEKAMGWMIVYGANPVRDLYNLPNVPRSVARHLASVTTPEQKAVAGKFAQEFQEIKLAMFMPPATARRARNSSEERTRPQGGGGSRRRENVNSLSCIAPHER